MKYILDGEEKIIKGSLNLILIKILLKSKYFVILFSRSSQINRLSWPSVKYIAFKFIFFVTSSLWLPFIFLRWNIACFMLTRYTLHRGVQRPPNCAPPSLSLERDSSLERRLGVGNVSESPLPLSRIRATTLRYPGSWAGIATEKPFAREKRAACSAMWAMM